MKTTDVAVIGGGLVGLATALRLSETTLEVTLIDKGHFGDEASMAGAGMLTAQTFVGPLDPGAPNFGMEHAHFYASHQARDLYPVFAAKVEAMSGTSVPMEMDGILCAAASDAEHESFEAQAKWQTDQGLKAKVLSAEELTAAFPGVVSRGGVHFEQDGWVDNQALVHALRVAVKGAGITVLENCPVAPLRAEGGSVTRIETEQGHIEAKHVVLCAGAWTDTLLPECEPKLGMHPVRGQILLFEGEDTPSVPVISGEWYTTPRENGRVLVGATVEPEAGFNRAITGKGIADILDGVRPALPMIDGWRFLQANVGLRPCTGDGFPVIGKAHSTENLWLGAGHYRHGILWAPLTAEWITRGILGETFSPEAQQFDSSRFLVTA